MGGKGVALPTLTVGPIAEQAESWYGQAPLLKLGPAVESFSETMAIPANLQDNRQGAPGALAAAPADDPA